MDVGADRATDIFTYSPEVRFPNGLKETWNARVPGPPRIKLTDPKEKHENFIQLVCQRGWAPNVDNHTYIVIDINEQETKFTSYGSLVPEVLDSFQPQHSLDEYILIVYDLIWHVEREVKQYKVYIPRTCLN